jgi:PAS domain S-box-containing protein
MAALNNSAFDTSRSWDAGANRRMMKKLVEQLDDGYYEVDLRGHFTYVNARLAHLLGSTRELLIAPGQRHFRHYTDPATAERLGRAFAQTLERQASQGLVEGRFVRADGEMGFAEISIALMYDADDVICGFCGIVRDVTGRRDLENALDRRIKLLAILQQVDVELNHNLDIERVLTTAMNAAMILSNADAGAIALLDGAMLHNARVAGDYDQQRDCQPGGIVGRVLQTRRPELVTEVENDPDYVALIPETQAQITCPLLTHDKLIGVLVLETGDRTRFTTEVFEFAQLLTARIAAAIDNAQLYGLAQQQLEELRTLNAQLHELEQLKTDMIRIASHDLRSPLGIIGGYLSIIREDMGAAITPTQEQYFESMLQGLERIDRLTTDFLSLERLQSAKQAPCDPVDLDMLVNKAVYDARGAAMRKTLTFYAETPGAPLLVTGEETDLYEAIVNLIGNALKYTPPLGAVQVKLSVSDNQACFIVEDTGIGIPDEYQARLFQSFFRVKTLETRDIPGTGLGLHLVKKIVDRHRGTILFQSTHGQGSMFGFTIPLYAAPMEREGRGSRSTQTGE